MHENKIVWRQWTLILIFCVDVHMGLDPLAPTHMRPPESDPLPPPCGRHKWMAPTYNCSCTIIQTIILKFLHFALSQFLSVPLFVLSFVYIRLSYFIMCTDSCCLVAVWWLYIIKRIYTVGDDVFLSDLVAFNVSRQPVFGCSFLQIVAFYGLHFSCI